MANRSQDWFNQSIRDLELARECQETNKHEWACFAAQQAAEKAVKSLHLYFGQKAKRSVISKLLKELLESINLPKDLIEKGQILDNYYIPSRYPCSHSEGAPFQYFGRLHSERAINYAGEIIEFVRSQMA